MSRLSDRYLTVMSRTNADAAECDRLEFVIRCLHERGVAAHPELPVSDLMFAAHLGRCGAPLARDPEEIHAADLFLACGALAGDARAVASCAHNTGRS